MELFRVEKSALYNTKETLNKDNVQAQTLVIS